MQTKQEIQRLLAGAGVGPNKRLGQHFLVDLNLMRYLLNCARLGPADIALEVGCGTGSLTEALIQRAGQVVAVEVDEVLAEIAKEQLDDADNVEIINTDVLSGKHQLDERIVDALQNCRAELPGHTFLIGNLPYNIAAPVMLNLIAGPTVADRMYVTVQKEVAQRMTAKPGSKHYGVLTIFMAATGSVKKLKTLKPSVFWPRPQVDSAMISFIRNRRKAERIESMQLFSEVVNLFMQHRRKMLKSCVKFAKGKLADIKNWTEIFEKANAKPNHRPEDLLADKYVAIANLCCRADTKISG